MKNIYTLPTDKPSRLVGSRLNLSLKDIPIPSFETFKTYNIYITSDEEIKEGDWTYDILNNLVYKYLGGSNEVWNNAILASSQKIVLTTDSILIEDYVQEVSEDFLKWFVRNSECNYVETKNMLQTRWGSDWIDLPNQNEGREPDGIYRKIYKTILPSNEITPEQLFNDDKRELVKKAILEHKNSNTSPEEELLNNIKYVLSVGNESQAIRLIEQYGHWKQEGLFSEENVNEIIAETWNSCEDNEGETYTQARERIMNTHKNK